MKRFNITGVCDPQLHYMVDISNKIEKIVTMVERGEYFTINRARQYGKTTTLMTLEERRKDDYIVISISFEGLGNSSFANEENFVARFNFLCERELKRDGKYFNHWCNSGDAVDMVTLGDRITKFVDACDKPIMLLIDEVDKTSNNQLFLDFLGMLRTKYLNRRKDSTFQSVILAGVYDIKNIKLKLRPDEQRSYNSPWNIAATFDVDMSFSPDEIATMLVDYECDHNTGMGVSEISNEIYNYTNGYPFLVSNICKIIDEYLDRDWTINGVHRAVGAILREKTPLFESIIKNLEEYPELNSIAETILLYGKPILYNIDNRYIDLGVTFGLFKRNTLNVEFYNTIFETRIYNYMISVAKFDVSSYINDNYIQHGKLNMEYVLTRFQDLMKAEYRTDDSEFIEKQGRLLFLCFLKPIINGTGHYAVESETRENTRMDIVVYYGGEEFIIELKIWHGEKQNIKARKQLVGYLDSRGLRKGYLVSFSFNKEKEYTSGWIDVDGKDVFEVVV